MFLIRPRKTIRKCCIYLIPFFIIVMWLISNHTTKHIKRYTIRERKTTTTIDCVKISTNDRTEITRAKTNKESQKQINLQNLFDKGCQHFLSERGYIMDSLTSEEDNFPIAYSMVVFKDDVQFERLLRAIYRPQNIYCIHVDIKSDNLFRESIRNISSCFNNVFLSSRSVSVSWGDFSVLETDLICMQDLLKYKKWKYFINLTGQEFPLRTNYELVKILKIYNGANDLEGTRKRANKNRWNKLVKPPGDIIPTKGSVHITANRDFINYIVNNKTAQSFLNWTRLSSVPDETFFSSLNHNPHLKIPGSYKGEPETDPYIKPFLTRFKNWGTWPFNWQCYGKRVRMVCVFGVEDVPLLVTRPEFFANKFYTDFEPLALDCMEEIHYNRTREQFEYNLGFNSTYYEQLPFIKNIVK